jgi:hypothetical protein
MSVLRVRSMSFASMLVTVIIAVAPLASAFAQTTDEPSVTVKVQPDRIPPGGSVTISGLGYAQAGAQIIITVTPPSGAKTTLNAVPDNQSRYSVPFIGAKAPGTYTVSAQAGAKGAPAKTQFTVQSSVIDIDEDVADNKKFLEEAQELVKAVKKQVDNVPDSPAKTEMEGKLSRLEPALANLAQQSAQLPLMLQPFKTLLAQHPETQPALQPMLDHLAELDQKTRDEIQTVGGITAQSQKTLASCDAIDHATQSLKAVSEVLDILRKPFEFVSGYASDMAKGSLSPESGEAVDQAAKAANLAHELKDAGGEDKEEVGKAMRGAKGSIVENGMELGSETAIAEKLIEAIPESVRQGDGYKLAVTEIKKFVPRVIADAEEPVKLFDDAAALTTDLVTYANEKFFARYCEKFEGPFSATMTAYFYAKGYDKDWWHFSIAIKGKLTLRYPKGASGNVVPLSGQFEGGATNFGYNESVWTNSDLFKIAKGGLLGHKDTAPWPEDSGKGGVLASLASRTSFYIPVSGQYANGKVTFKLQDARTDFNKDYVKGHTFYVVMSVYTLGYPVMNSFSLPYMDAHFLMGHFVFDYPVAQGKDSMAIEKHDVQDRAGPGNKAHYTLTLKACNPGCE